MKAWTIENEQSDDGYCTVVFAETRGKAHKIAMGTDCCEDADWNDVRVTRNPKMDAMYRGNSEMDWYDADCENCPLGWEDRSYEGECNDCGCLFNHDFDVPAWKCMLPNFIKNIIKVRKEKRNA